MPTPSEHYAAAVQLLNDWAGDEITSTGALGSELLTAALAHMLGAVALELGVPGTGVSLSPLPPAAGQATPSGTVTAPG